MKIEFFKGSKHPKTDCRVIGVFEEAVPALHGGSFSNSQKRSILDELRRRGSKGSKGEDVLLVQDGEPILVLGLGKHAKLKAETLRRAAARAATRAKAEKWLQIAIEIDTFLPKDDAAYSVQAFAEGLRLATYKFDVYKSAKKSGSAKQGLAAVFLITQSAPRKDLARALDESKTISESVAIARTLGNEPPNVLYPESYANRIRAIAREAGLQCTVFDEKKMAQLKMGGILGVGQGSQRKPRLVILEHRPAGAKSAKPVVLVGKGVTFDTGGISLKPGKDMEQMKFDMCGSAAVVAALRTSALLKLRIPVIGILPIAENMPGGGAQRPGDVIVTYSGKTVDVLNTDAEGRLILADALAYSKKYTPRCVVDIATLTGMCSAFFGNVASGLMGNDKDVVKRLKTAADKTGERVWELPLWNDYEDLIKGSYGDIQNISRGAAGTITAGMFLKHFGGHSPWAHLDIAGTAWGTSARGYNPVGATGVGVRLFIEFLKSYS